MSFPGHWQQWLITDCMASAQLLNMLACFLLGQEPCPVRTAWALQVEAGNQERLARLERVGSRETIASGSKILNSLATFNIGCLNFLLKELFTDRKSVV